MSNSGGFAVTRTHSGDRFYNPPMRRHHQLFFRRQQWQRQSQKENKVESVEVDSRTDSDDSTLSRPNSVSSPKNADLTNLDRLIDSVTPFVPVRHSSSEARLRGWRTGEVDESSFFSLEDFWESLSEWSVYGVEVPLLLSGGRDTVKQYYVPSLSAIQLFTDPHGLRRSSEEGDAKNFRGTVCSVEVNDHESQRQVGGADGTRSQNSVVQLNSQRLNRLDKNEDSSLQKFLAFEYLEQEAPHLRQPLFDKVSTLASSCPEITMYRSCDLLPESWVSVAWYPIYRIPVGPTLQNLDASFLTFHCLSTQTRSINQPEFNACSGRNAFGGGDASCKVRLPVFGLASYKLRNSIFNSKGAKERQQVEPLWEAAENWLKHLKVDDHYDFNFFVSQNSKRR